MRAIAALAIGGPIVATAALCAGSTGWHAPWQLTGVLVELRGPRVVLAGLVGASLAVAGAAMQTLLRNDLADPYVLGLSGGASAGAVTSLALRPAMAPGPAAAIGAATAALLVRALARGPHDPVRLLLAGVAVSSILASATGLVLTLAPAAQLLRSTSAWLYGGLGTPRWTELALPAIALGLALVWLGINAARLDRLTLGDDVATSLGVEVARVRRGAVAIAVVLTALAVAASGLVGFVGLIAPHAARRLGGAAHRRLIALAALIGAILVMAADAIARTAFAPREVPVGLVTAALGGPFFLWQLQRAPR
ncbi:MAG: iron ABC transporter permease [Deltaproteobacteria bacterium]|nr:iron ABC transporter permease [Deltaproteobacteria bacterium]